MYLLRTFNTGKIIRKKIIETIEIKSVKSWKRNVIECFEDLKFICKDYSRTILRYPGKLNRLLHEERIDQSEYDDLKKSLLKTSEAINDIPRTIIEIK
ncbi:MAG: hypothetical protein PVG96_15490 [Desulfobacterales bacterium]